MRILVGTVEIGGCISDFADGFRALGHDVVTVIAGRHPFQADAEYDYDIAWDADVIRWPNSILNSRSLFARIPRGLSRRFTRYSRIAWLTARTDLFFFQWAGSSLIAANRDYPILKRLGKRIVTHFMGDDVRHHQAYRRQVSGLPLTDSFCDFLVKNRDSVVPPLRRVRTAERYADCLLACPSVDGLMVRPYMHGFLPLKIAEYRNDIPGREVPVIIHAPSSSAVKGTDEVLAALTHLRDTGVAFELQLLQGVPNAQVVDACRRADIVVDQLDIPLHGKLGLEAMASGCALATCNLYEYEPFPPNRPIWHVDRDSLVPRLKELLTNRDLRVRLAQDGRQYVERYHDHVHVARRILDHVTGKAPVCDHYPTFFARKFQLDDGQEIPERLKRLTSQVVQRHGLPDDVDPEDMIARGLMSRAGLDPRRPIPRWNAAETGTLAIKSGSRRADIREAASN
jgi:hypothetical protein